MAVKNARLRRLFHTVNVPLLVAFKEHAEDGEDISIAPMVTDGDVLVMTNENESGEAYSPVSGEKMENTSVGEIASTPDEMQDLVEIGHCDHCDVVLRCDESLASALEQAGIEEMHCVHCGEVVSVEQAMDDESDDGVGDDDESDDDLGIEDDESDDESEDDESEDDMSDDESDDDESDDDSESEDDTSDEVASLLAEIEVALEQAMEDSEDDMSDDDSEDDDSEDDESDDMSDDDSEDDDSEDDESDDDSEDDSEDEMSEMAMATDIYSITDRTGDASLLFADGETAHLLIGDTVVGTFHKAKAAKETAGAWASQTSFNTVLGRHVQKGVLESASVPKELTDLGFVSPKVSIPLDFAAASVIEREVAAAVEAAVDQIETTSADADEAFGKLFGTASLAINKGLVDAPKGSSITAELAGLLEASGNRQAFSTAKSFVDRVVNPHVLRAIELANELKEKGADYASGFSQTAARAGYQFEGASDKITEDAIISTALPVVKTSTLPTGKQARETAAAPGTGAEHFRKVFKNIGRRW